jgi:[glutamine synthetase] adenylyltransferase / [glutamine synthetase]-adenylyl-L-tyrosine phosphorylase
MPLPSRQELAELLSQNKIEEIEVLLDVSLPEMLRDSSSFLFAKNHEDSAEFLLAVAGGPQPSLVLDALVELARSSITPLSTWPRLTLDGLSKLFGASPAARRHFKSHPAHIEALVDESTLRQARHLDDFKAEVESLSLIHKQGEIFLQNLRRYRVAQWLRIGLREVLRLDEVEVVLAEISDLAEAMISVVTERALANEKERRGPLIGFDAQEAATDQATFSVLALGKLGARELNLSSDVDLLFICSHEQGPENEGMSLHQRFSKIAQAIRETLSSQGPEGFCFRVDLDLRPEGSKGALVNSLTSAERYYESWGQHWERLALIRARHVGGDASLSELFIQRLRPFMFPRSLHSQWVDEIRLLKNRVHVRHETRSQAHRGLMNLKKDPGGIREIELFLQILQLLCGGHQSKLREPSIFGVLEHLLFLGMLGSRDHRSLKEAYTFYRRLENSLQLREELQTYKVEAKDCFWEHHAWVLGLSSKEGREIFEEHRRVVLEITKPLLGEDFIDEIDLPAQQMLTLEGQPQRELLEELGFYDSEQAQSILAFLYSRVGSPFNEHSRSSLRALAVLIVRSIYESPDPNQALRLYCDLDSLLRKHPAYYRLLSIAQFRRRLFELLGSSEYLGRPITRSPELVDWLAKATDPGELSHVPEAAVLEARAKLRMGRAKQLSHDPEMALRSLRRFNQQELLRIALVDLGGLVPIRSILNQLATLAETCIKCVLDFITQDSSGFVVLAMGGLGAREMAYGSDLDLIFVWDPNSFQAQDLSATRLAQTLISYLSTRLHEGYLYRTDTRLRPLGNQGLLVTTGRSFVDYYKCHAMMWECQSLLRARPVAGDVVWGEEILKTLSPYRYPKTLTCDAAKQMCRLRDKMEGQQYGTTAKLKTGKGGLVDIEFIVQFMQMKHAYCLKSLRCTGTFEALEAMLDEGCIDDDAGHFLLGAYSFLRLLENRLRIVHNRESEEFDPNHPSMRGLARRMGYREGTNDLRRLLTRYTDTCEQVREHYLKFFTSEPES